MPIKSNDRINQDQINLVENAQNRIRQKKRLFYHFSIMFFGDMSFLTFNLLFGFKDEVVLFDYPWSYLAIALWFLIFLIHFYNVFITNKFMGDKWEREQIKKLVSKQELKITKLKMEFEKKQELKQIRIFNQKIQVVYTLIAAASENNVIGNNNKLIWHLLMT